MKTLLLGVVCLLGAMPAWAQQTQPWIASSGTWSGPSQTLMAAGQTDWEALWAKAGGQPPAPAVDFHRFLVMGSFLENSFVLMRRERPAALSALLAGPPAASQSHANTLQKSVNGALQRNQQNWDLSFSFGPGRTQYFPTDITVKTSRMDVVLHDVDIRERHSMEYYDFSKNPQPLRAIDEPTNTFNHRFENKKKGYAAYAQLFHPKFLVSAEGLNGSVQAEGTMDGKPVNGPIDINEVFPKYQLTYGLVNIAVGAEKLFPIVKGKAGSLTYAPGISPGMFLGLSAATLRDPAEAKGFKEYRAQKFKPIGASISVTNRLTYAVPGERVKLSLTHTLTGGELDYDFLDGTAHQKLNYHHLNASLAVRVYKQPRKHRKRQGGQQCDLLMKGGVGPDQLDERTQRSRTGMSRSRSEAKGN